MKKLLQILPYFFSFVSLAQTSDQLIAVYQFANTAAINAIANPIRGSLAFNQSDSLLYFYDGMNWIEASASAASKPTSWSLNGNTVNSTDFLGTTNNQNLNFRVNNNNRWRMSSRGTLIPVNTGNNVYIGNLAGNSHSSTLATSSVGVGFSSLRDNTSGYSNSAAGSWSLLENTTGNNNVAYGASAMENNTTGIRNTAIGARALNQNTSGQRNVAIGYNAMYSGNNTNSAAIGYDVQVNANNTYVIGNSSVISIGGQLAWAIPSDQRFKENIKENIVGLDFIMGLKPVSYNFNYKKKNDHHGFHHVLTSKEEYQKAYEVVRNGFF